MAQETGQIDVDEIVKLGIYSFQNMLNDLGYNLSIKWLLKTLENIIENQNDIKYQVVNFNKIIEELNAKKHVEILQVLLELSGFQKSTDNTSNQWIYDRNKYRDLKKIHAFWSIIHSNWSKSNEFPKFENTIKELMDYRFTLQDAKLAIYASLSEQEKYPTCYCNNSQIESPNIKYQQTTQTSTEINQFITELMEPDMNQSTVDSKYLLNSTYIYGERSNADECKLVSTDCTCFIRLKTVLNRYNVYIEYQQLNDDKNPANIDDIYDDNYTDTDLLNDFNHLLFYHSNEFEDIYDILIEESDNNTICSLSNCLSLRRNHRNRFIENKGLYFNAEMDDDRDIVRQQFLDRIHSYYFHSFDTGFRMTRKEKQNILVSIENESNDTDVGNPFSRNVKAIHNLIKKKLYCNMNELISSNRDRFAIEIDEKQAEDEYIYGFRYFYWNYYKNNHLNTDPSKTIQQRRFVYALGANVNSKLKTSKLRDWYVSKKFAHLKQELLNNQIMCLGLNQYNQLIQKAILKIRTDICRQMQCPRNQSAMYYEMKFGQLITVKHLIAMMVYCNYDKLSYKFTETFRKITRYESNDEMKERHRNYYHLGRYLRECVECFGMRGYCEQNKHIQLYHGINKSVTFSSIYATINGPLSTTHDYCVAATFCNNKGMILSIDIDIFYWVFHHEEGDGAKQTLNCFDCQWLSDFANEAEVLFIGGSAAFSFNTIIEAPSAIDYWKYVKGLRHMTHFMNSGVPRYNANDAPSTKEQTQMLFRLLSHEIWRYAPNHRYGYEFQSCPDYFKNILHQHCQSIITISFLLQSKQSKVHDILLKDEFGWINIDLLLKIFPNTRGLICEASKDDDSYIEPSVIMGSLFQFLQQNKDTKLEYLRIYIDDKFYQSMSNEIDLYRPALFHQYKWIVWYMNDDDRKIIFIANLKISSLL